MDLGRFLRLQELLRLRFRFGWIRTQLLLLHLKSLGLLLEVHL